MERRAVTVQARSGAAILVAAGVGLAVTSALSASIDSIGLAAGSLIALVAAALLIRNARVQMRLETSLAELQSSRDELRASLARIGDALRSTHEMTGLLRVVLETTTSVVKAKGGAVYLQVGASELGVRCAVNLDRTYANQRLRIGEGIAGRVAKERKALLVPSDDVSPAPSQGEPEVKTAMGVPLENSKGQIVGVLALYDRVIDEPFTQSDLETASSVARQAGVAVENAMLHQEAQKLSITDSVTGVWNRRYLSMRLAQEVERSIRFRRPLSVLMLDVDHFKRINDEYGHHRGDSVLVELAERVMSAVRGQVDTVARYGGEEFVLVLPETSADGARIVAQKIVQTVAQEPFGADGEQPVWVTVSIGSAAFPKNGYTQTTLLRAADDAMYEAKARGRNCTVAADEIAPAGSGGIAQISPQSDQEPPQERNNFR
ncbi:MAG: GGDEF domain-containing protein [Actinomycetota bacterium]